MGIEQAQSLNGIAAAERFDLWPRQLDVASTRGEWAVLRDDFKEQSDIDFLVELSPDSRVGLFKFMNMQFEFEDLIHRKADLRTIDDFPERLKKNVFHGAELLYSRD